MAESESNWVPNTSFEDEMLAIQPDYDLIFAHDERNPARMAAATLCDEIADLQNYEIPDSHSEVNIVQKVLLKNQSIGRRIGKEDLELEDTRETEIVAMLRNIGIQPSLDEPLNSKTTLPAIISNEPYKKASIPILLDESYFKLKPRKSLSSSNDQSENNLDSSADTGDISSSFDDQFKSLNIVCDNNNSKINELENGKIQSVPGKSAQRDSPIDSNLVAQAMAVCNGQTRKRKRHTNVAMANIATIKSTASNDSESNVENIQLFRKDNSYMTPKELYLKKRGNLPS